MIDAAQLMAARTVPSMPLQHPTPDSPRQTLGEEKIQGVDARIVEGLRDVRRQAAMEYEGPWRSHFRQNIEAEEFWKGNHYGVPSDDGFSFRTPFEFLLERERLDELPTYQYAINLYQAFGLTAITILSQRIPKVRWFPVIASDEVDITTAKAASKLSAYIEEKNDIKTLAQREAYLSWTQGLFGTWTRFIRDKKFGKTMEPVVSMSTVEIAPDRYVCDVCGSETPAEEMTGACAACGEMLSDQHFVEGEMAEVPIVSEYKETPRGMVKMSVYGATNLCVCPYVNEFDDSGYLILNEEVPVSAIRATWKNEHNAEPSGGEAMGAGADASARQARMAMADAPAPFSGGRNYGNSTKAYSTLQRCWFRPWYLHQCSDEALRKLLIETYPNGVYVAFADDQFLEAAEADVDEEWSLCFPMPGQGLYRQSIGASTIPINKQIDDAANIVAEHVDFGSAPPMFVDSYHINTSALGRTPMKPGVYVPVQRQNGGSTRQISEFFYQPQFKMDTNIYGYGKSLIEIGQIVSSVMPPLFGGPLKGNDTLGAYTESSNQAMNKLLMFWQATKGHHARAMTQAIIQFQKYQTDDIVTAVVGESGDVIAQYIKLSEIQGSTYAKPESDEDFPASLSEVRQNLLGMFQQAPQLAQQLFAMPSFYPTLRKFVGNDEIEFPAEAQRAKTYREIDRLLQAEPLEIIDPLTGVPSYAPSIPVDVWIDNHPIAIATIREWGMKRGVEEHQINPAGYANVMAKLLAHYDAQAIVAQKEAMMAPVVPGGEGPPEEQR